MKNILYGLLLVFLLGANHAAMAKDSDKSRKPPTKVTEKISPKVYKVMEQAQLAMEAKDLTEAESLINLIQAKPDKLNDYEKAQMFNFLAAIHYEQGQTDKTIQDYIGILKLENPPEQLRNNSLFRLAQLYFVQEDYARSVKLLDKWMSLQSEGIRPEAYMLKAQAYYQLDQYQEAKAPIISAMKEARRRDQPLSESWLGLLRAVYYELGDYKGASKVLGEMIARWPKPSYYKQLSGMLGLLKSQRGQLYVMHGAAAAGMLEKEFEILNMARLYMAEDAPFAAIELLQQNIASGVVEENAQNLQLLAQAMSLAKDAEGQIPVLSKAANLAGESKLYVYLGQAQIALYQWEDAAKSLQTALKIGDVERPGSLHMQIGTAYYNLKRYSKALQAFKEAGAYEKQAKSSRQWVTFVQHEIKRSRAMRGL
ncbi:MAG: tetratricopeptide repeat protein [Oceanococcus sp.]